MKVLVFDTETTGLPTERNASIMDTEKWPYILQLSYVVYDTDEHLILDCVDDIIKIDNEKIKISAETTAIHGITNEMCDEKGVPLIDALKKFNETLFPPFAYSMSAISRYFFQKGVKFTKSNSRFFDTLSPFSWVSSLRQIFSPSSAISLKLQYFHG